MERKLRHAVVNINYHLIMVTKYRKKVIVGVIAERLKQECIRLLEENFEGHVTSIETDQDHVHILLEYTPVDHVHILTELSPKYSVMEIMASLKGVTSRIIRRDFHDMIKDQLWGDSFWSDSYYAATTGGVTLDVIKRYVESQGKPKRKYVRKKPLTSPPNSKN